MTRIWTMLVAAAIGMTAPSPALASLFSGSTFSATGALSVSLNGVPPTLACTVNFSGVVNADGTATVTSASVGGTLTICHEMTLATPIGLVANSTTSVTVTSLAITGPIACGPQEVTATWADGTPSQFDVLPVLVNPGSCTVSVHANVTGMTIIP